MIKTTLQHEILDFLEHEGDIINSPRAYHMCQAIQYAESNTDMCRMLAKAFTNLDKDLTTITEELIDARAHSTRTIIRPDSN